MLTHCEQLAKYIQVRLSLIVFFSRARMDDYLGNRVLIINLHQCIPFFRTLDPDPRFDGNAQIRIPKNLIQKAIQLLYIRKHACAASTCHHCAGRTAQIQVYFLIPILRQRLRRLHEAYRIARQNLRNELLYLIVLGKNIPQLPFPQSMLLIRHNERRKIPIRPRKIRIQRMSENVSGHPLQRGKVKFHSSSISCSFYFAVSRAAEMDCEYPPCRKIE